MLLRIFGNFPNFFTLSEVSKGLYISIKFYKKRWRLAGGRLVADWRLAGGWLAVGLRLAGRRLVGWLDAGGWLADV